MCFWLGGSGSNVVFAQCSSSLRETKEAIIMKRYRVDRCAGSFRHRQAGDVGEQRILFILTITWADVGKAFKLRIVVVRILLLLSRLN